jgi:hypothetical protein
MKNSGLAVDISPKRAVSRSGNRMKHAPNPQLIAKVSRKNASKGCLLME